MAIRESLKDKPVPWTPEEDDHLVSFGARVHVEKYPYRTLEAAKVHLSKIRGRATETAKPRPQPQPSTPAAVEGPAPAEIAPVIAPTPKAKAVPSAAEICRIPLPVSITVLRSLADALPDAKMVRCDGAYLVLEG